MTAGKHVHMRSVRSPAPLGSLEAAIMDVLWNGGPVSAVELHRALEHRGLAYTTVATELTRLLEKGLVAREGRYATARYRAALGREAHTEAIVSSTIGGLIKTYGRAAIHGFLDVVGDDPEALAEFRKSLAEREQ